MSKVFSVLFLISLVAYFAFAMAEELLPGFVSDYFNPHLLLIPVLIFLTTALVYEKGEVRMASSGGERLTSKSRKSQSLLIFLAGAITLGILWIGGREIETAWRVLMAVYGGLLVVGILTVLFKE
ncbi:MAG: hypothetical protein UX98_C0005G0065 [Parcubacteria group bacterium GW2011_GWA2_47_26]|nr:MAG: hypothetical protein UX98_C0005G0065 [Parcubacteria group bacterium GW2011_GWA2_47_26]